MKSRLSVLVLVIAMVALALPARLGAQGPSAPTPSPRLRIDREVVPVQAGTQDAPPPASSGTEIRKPLSDLRERVAPALTTVPDVRGRTVQDATGVLERSNLKLSIVERRPSDAPPETILEQKPPAGARVSASSTVEVVVSVAPRLVAVPPLRGRPVPSAGVLLERLGLRLRVVGQRPGDGPPNSIVDQKPEAGARVNPGSIVSVVVVAPPAPPPGGTSDGGRRPTPEPPPTVTVPDVRGQTAEAASRLLKRARLRLEVIRGRRDAGTADAIVEQKPSPGERVAPGSIVGVVLAAAPTLIAVPDVRGRSLEDAGRLLARSRLQMAIRDRRAGDGPPNSVADQTPAAGNLVPPGATVGVVVLVPPAPPPGGTSGGGTRPPPEPPRVTVPEVRGRTVDAASQILERSRLQLEISQRRENAGAVGTVIDQSPAAGERVAPGSTVGVVLAVAPRLIAVPDVRGRPVEEATRILSRSRLRLRVADRRPGDGPPDTVIEQRPVPESRVAPGSTVSVAILAPLAPSPGDESGQPLVVGPPSGGVGPLVPPSPGRPGPGAPPGSGQPRTPTPPNGDRPASGTPIAPPITDRPTVSTPSTPVVTESTPAPAGGNTAPTPGTQSRFRLAIIVGVTLLVGLGAGIGLTRGWQSKRLQVGTAPVVRMMASPDLGLPEVKTTSGPAVSIDVRLRPHRDPGQQTIITNGAAALGEARSG